MDLRQLTDIFGDKNDALLINGSIERLGLEIRPAAKANDLYKYRLAPVGEKRILAHFNTVQEIDKYLKELENITTGDTTMTM